MKLDHRFLPVIPGRGWYINHNGYNVPIVAFAVRQRVGGKTEKYEIIGFLEDGSAITPTMETPFFQETEVR